MLSALTSLIPVLTGPNYQTWAPLMTSFLMSQGQWRILQKEEPKPVAVTATSDGNEAAIEEWHETNGKAVGNIRLRLHHSIQYKFREHGDAGVLWNTLQEAYGQPGVVSIYLEFKAAFETIIPDNADPSLALDKIASHFGRLADSGVVLDEHFQCMIVMAKIPPSMEMLAQTMCQTDDFKKWKMETFRKGNSPGLGVEDSKSTTTTKPGAENQRGSTWSPRAGI